MGERPGRADVMAKFVTSMVKHMNWLDLEKEHPGLNEWLERIYERDAWKRALVKRNEYDLNVFPKIPGR
jgi:glutathione S-transferase